MQGRWPARSSSAAQKMMCMAALCIAMCGIPAVWVSMSAASRLPPDCLQGGLGPSTKAHNPPTYPCRCTSHLPQAQANFDDAFALAFSNPLPVAPTVGLHAVHGDARAIASAAMQAMGFRVKHLPAAFSLSGDPNLIADCDVLVLPWNDKGQKYAQWKASTLPLIEKTGATWMCKM
jgi:hypothetical protein